MDNNQAHNAEITALHAAGIGTGVDNYQPLNVQPMEVPEPQPMEYVILIVITYFTYYVGIFSVEFSTVIAFIITLFNVILCLKRAEIDEQEQENMRAVCIFENRDLPQPNKTAANVAWFINILSEMLQILLGVSVTCIERILNFLYAD